MNFSRYEGLDALRVFCSFGVVFLHVYVTTGFPDSLDLWIKLRDFALPAMVLTSFFLLTRSLMRWESGFASFLGRRIERLWVPLIFWTFFYCAALAFVFPVIYGSDGKPNFPSSGVFLIGYRHLWYLQFIFIASLVVYLLFAAFTKLRIPPRRLTVGCLAASLIYGFLYYSLIKELRRLGQFYVRIRHQLRNFRLTGELLCDVYTICDRNRFNGR